MRLLYQTSKDKAAIDFAIRLLAKDSHSSSEQDFQTLRELEFDDEEIRHVRYECFL